MIFSMTGFGKAQREVSRGKLFVEIRSLNSKNIDISIKNPLEYRSDDLKIRKLLSSELLRGKIDVKIYLERLSSHSSVTINKETIKNYITQLRGIAESSDSELLKIAMTLPKSTKLEEETKEQEAGDDESIISLIQKAASEVKLFRKQEGEALQGDIISRVIDIESCLKSIEKIATKRKDDIRLRLMNLVSDLEGKIDQNRFEQELIYYLEKLDITEELVRLKAHIDYFIKTINSSDACGKKLGFISQEMGREINTIGSKSNNVIIQQRVVDMKDELEKIKEQLLNVL